MYKFFIQNYKNFFVLLFLYFLILSIKNIFNIYTLLVILILILYTYKTNKRLLKRIIYKFFYRTKGNITFKNKMGAVKLSLNEIKEINNQIKDKVNSELLLYQKKQLEYQLNSGDYNVILFGAGSSGKTSIARALLKNIIGKTSPTIGTTSKLTSYKIKIPILKRNINIIDTPGLFEPSLIGERREKSTIIEATKSDLIIFVVDQDINKYELYLIKQLSEIGKKLIIVLNKCDLRTQVQNDLICKNIISVVSREKLKLTLIKSIAKPQYYEKDSRNLIKKVPEVNNLFREIIETLDENGEELLADNILLRCNKLGLLSKKLINEQRDISANKIINKYAWITGGVILVNPLPVIDFLTTTSVNIQMILDISKVYDIKITKKEASELSKSLIETIAKLGILKGGLNIITSTLSSNYTTLFVSKSIQSITTGWLIRIVGLSIVKYFSNGQKWGNGGVQEVVNNVYKLNKRDKILNNFIDEAIAKIKIRKENDSVKKLPPFDSDY